jgi:ABC-2 type transport system ATP-binding protein
VSAEVVLEVDAVSKHYGERTALRDVSFAVSSGELVALIGPNGAGKTTLLSVLAGVLAPDGGGVSCRPEVGAIGWVPQQAAIYTRLTVVENLRLWARLEGVPDAGKTVARMLKQTDLVDRADEQVGRLSGGNRQRVNIAVGLLSEPRVLLLDEPSAALDPIQRGRLWEFVGALGGQGTSVVFSTHNVAEAEHYAGRVLVLDEGRLLFDGSPGALMAKTTGGGAGEGTNFEEAFAAFLQSGRHARQSLAEPLSGRA